MQRMFAAVSRYEVIDASRETSRRRRLARVGAAPASCPDSAATSWSTPVRASSARSASSTPRRRRTSRHVPHPSGCATRTSRKSSRIRRSQCGG